jgi:hypothetical protein
MPPGAHLAPPGEECSSRAIAASEGGIAATFELRSVQICIDRGNTANLLISWLSGGGNEKVRDEGDGGVQSRLLKTWGCN